MLLKYCTQYVRKFGKLSSGHRTGKGPFHSNLKERQSQRKFKLPYNCIHFHTSARLGSKSFKLGFSSMQTKNFQMYKLDLETQKNQRSNFQHSWLIEKAREFQRAPTCALLSILKPLTVWITTNSGKFFKRWEYQTTLPASWETCI